MAPLHEPSRTRVAPAPRRRVRLPTEGTYPYATGGVSSWCDLLVSRLDEFDWDLPNVARGGRAPEMALGPGELPAWRTMLVPAYLPPAGIIDLLQDSARPRIVIINPHNGPGVEPRRSYGDAVRVAHEGGTRVLGYVATGHGMRPAADVLADIDRHTWWYRVDGIFLDEVTQAEAELPYYAALSRHIKAACGRLVALNPGAVPARGYFDIADIVVTFEGAYADYAVALSRMPGWTRALPPDRIAHLVHGASREQALAAVRHHGDAGYVYVTSGSPPNPWRTLPSYLHEQEQVLRG